jgi:hypothetical protein
LNTLEDGGQSKDETQSAVLFYSFRVLALVANENAVTTSWAQVRRQANEENHVRFEVFTAVTMKNGVFWVVTPCGSCTNRCFGGTWRFIHQDDKNR